MDMSISALLHRIKKRKNKISEDKNLDRGDLVQRVIVISGFAVTAILVTSWIGSSLAYKAIDISNCIALGTDRVTSGTNYYIGAKIDNDGNADTSNLYQSSNKCEISMSARQLAQNSSKLYERMGFTKEDIIQLKSEAWDKTTTEEKRKEAADFKEQFPNSPITEHSTSEDLAKFIDKTVLPSKPTVEDEYNKRFQ